MERPPRWNVGEGMVTTFAKELLRHRAASLIFQARRHAVSVCRPCQPINKSRFLHPGCKKEPQTLEEPT